MPSTAVASRKRSWKRIENRYKKHSREFYEKKQSIVLHKYKLIAQRKAQKKH